MLKGHQAGPRTPSVSCSLPTLQPNFQYLNQVSDTSTQMKDTTLHKRAPYLMLRSEDDVSYSPPGLLIEGRRLCDSARYSGTASTWSFERLSRNCRELQTELAQNPPYLILRSAGVFFSKSPHACRYSLLDVARSALPPTSPGKWSAIALITF
jgi:hypothetical protein